MDSSQISFFLSASFFSFPTHCLLTLHLSDTCLMNCCGIAGVVRLVDELWNENLIVQKWVTTIF